MNTKILLLSFLFICFSFVSRSQTDKIQLGQEYHNLSWNAFVQAVEKKHDVRFFYDPQDIPDFKMVVNEDSLLLEEILVDNLKPYQLKSTTDHHGNIFITKTREVRTSLSDNFFEATAVKIKEPADDESNDGLLKTYSDYIAETVAFGNRNNVSLKGKNNLSGYVTTAEEGEPLPQATLHIKETDYYTTTNVSGYYSLDLKPGEYTLLVNSLGRYEKKFKIKIYKDGHLNVSLDPKSFMLEETVVTAEAHHNVRSTQMGFEKIKAQQIKELPVVLGEQDIVKVALLLPGVQTVSEISSGFNVRGSPADQTVFYINNIPIYNSSHLFGMFSAFNSDAINDFSLYKSNIPVEYGGRLSSIFDVKTKRGNMSDFSARGGISPVSSRMMFEGPVVEDKSSYLMAVRTTYSDWILDVIKNPDVRNSNAYFGDALMDLTFQLNENNEVSVFGYASRDRSNLNIGFDNTYSNFGGSGQWVHNFSKALKSELNIIHSRYQFEENNDEIAYMANKKSFYLDHSELKLNFLFTPNKRHTAKVGFNSTFYQINQGDIVPLNEESILKPVEFQSEKSLKNSFYIGEEWSPNKKITLKGGLRYTLYSYLGPRTIYSYHEGSPVEESFISDTTHYGTNEVISKYNALDYRISGKYLITDEFSVKASYNRLHQYVFQLSNNISTSPTDKWKLSDPHIEPLEGDQYSLGFYKNFLNGQLEASIEGYYKTVDNLVEYEDGADLVFNTIPETEIIQGDLEAYGLEFMLKKPQGDFNGWINYTYSKAQVKAVNEATGEQNNLGLAYPANYDKPHALNLALNYKLTKRWSISTNIVYSTGRPITYPKSIYYLNDMEITGFSERNEYRLPDYFRVDLSLNLEGDLRKDKLAHGSWSFSFYNLTGRNNPYTLYFRNDNGKIKGYMLSIFGTVIPSITYNLKLGNYDD